MFKVNDLVLWNERIGTVIDVDEVDGRAMVRFDDGEDLSEDDPSYPSSMQYIPLDELTAHPQPD